MSQISLAGAPLSPKTRNTKKRPFDDHDTEKIKYSKNRNAEILTLEGSAHQNY